MRRSTSGKGYIWILAALLLLAGLLVWRFQPWEAGIFEQKEAPAEGDIPLTRATRSEERRVGKECRL